jgi:hypothetical protein
VPVVVSCPKCEKKLAVKDELKGRMLVCPQCKGKFSVPGDEAPNDRLPNVVEESSAGGGMDFLHGLGPSSVGATKGNGQTTAPAYSAQRSATSRPFASSAAAARGAGRSKKKADQMMMIYIGGGVAAVLLIVIVAALAINGSGGGGSSKPKEPADIRFGLDEGTRIKLFQLLVTTVDERGISKSCKDEWYRLADVYKLDRKNIKDLLDEGFSFKNNKWVLPEATSTAKNRAVRMDWVRERTNGPDPILAL